MSLLFGTSRNVSFNDDNHILKFFTEGFENLPSSFFLIPKICYRVLGSARGCIYTSHSESVIYTFAIRWQIIIVLLFHMKQVLVLLRTVFVDLKTINCHINLLDYLRQRSVPPVSAIVCRPDFPCFSRHTPLHFYSIEWVFLSVRPVNQRRRQLTVRFYPRWCYVRSEVGVSARRIGLAMNRFYTKQNKIFRAKKLLYLIFLAQKMYRAL